MQLILATVVVLVSMLVLVHGKSIPPGQTNGERPKRTVLVILSPAPMSATVIDTDREEHTCNHECPSCYEKLDKKTGCQHPTAPLDLHLHNNPSHAFPSSDSILLKELCNAYLKDASPYCVRFNENNHYKTPSHPTASSTTPNIVSDQYKYTIIESQKDNVRQTGTPSEINTNVSLSSSSYLDRQVFETTTESSLIYTPGPSIAPVTDTYLLTEDSLGVSLISDDVNKNSSSNSTNLNADTLDEASENTPPSKEPPNVVSLSGTKPFIEESHMNGALGDINITHDPTTNLYLNPKTEDEAQNRSTPSSNTVPLTDSSSLTQTMYVVTERNELLSEFDNHSSPSDVKTANQETVETSQSPTSVQLIENELPDHETETLKENKENVILNETLYKISENATPNDTSQNMISPQSTNALMEDLLSHFHSVNTDNVTEVFENVTDREETSANTQISDADLLKEPKEKNVQETTNPDELESTPSIDINKNTESPELTNLLEEHAQEENQGTMPLHESANDNAFTDGLEINNMSSKMDTVSTTSESTTPNVVSSSDILLNDSNVLKDPINKEFHESVDNNDETSGNLSEVNTLSETVNAVSETSTLSDPSMNNMTFTDTRTVPETVTITNDFEYKNDSNEEEFDNGNFNDLKTMVTIENTETVGNKSENSTLIDTTIITVPQSETDPLNGISQEIFQKNTDTDYLNKNGTSNDLPMRSNSSDTETVTILSNNLARSNISPNDVIQTETYLLTNSNNTSANRSPVLASVNLKSMGIFSKEDDEVENEGDKNSLPLDSGSYNCNKDGFFSIPGNCTAFYQCIDNGVNGYDKRIIKCDSGLVWDEKMVGCYFPHEVPPPCGTKASRDKINNKPTLEDLGSKESMLNKTHPNHGEKPPNNNTISNPSNKKVPNEASEVNTFSNNNYSSNGINQNLSQSPNVTKNFSLTKSPSNITVANLRSMFISETEGNEEQNTVQVGSNEDNSSEAAEEKYICTSDGSFPIPGECAYFYHCSKNGEGGYNRFIIKCGPGLVWHDKLGGCYYANEVPPPCGTKVTNDDVEQTKLPENSIPNNADSNSTSPNNAALMTAIILNTLLGNAQPRSDLTNKLETNATIINALPRGMAVNNRFTTKNIATKSLLKNAVKNKVKAKKTLKKLAKLATWQTLMNSKTKVPNLMKARMNLLSRHGISNVVSARTGTEDLNGEEMAINDFVCSSEGSNPITGTCTSFAYCIKNEEEGFDKFIVKCGPNLVWDVSLGGCYFKNKVPPPCGTKVQTTYGQDLSAAVSSDNVLEKLSSADSSPNDLNPLSIINSVLNVTLSLNQEENNAQENTSVRSDATLRDAILNGTPQSELVSKNEMSISELLNNLRQLTSALEELNANSTLANYTLPKMSPANVRSMLHLEPEQNEENTANVKGNEVSKSKSAADEFVCTSDGSFPIPGKCTAFYHCAYNGEGGYNRFIINCGPGLVWHEQIGGCYFANEVSPPCGTKGSNNASTIGRTSSSTHLHNTSQARRLNNQSPINRIVNNAARFRNAVNNLQPLRLSSRRIVQNPLLPNFNSPAPLLPTITRLANARRNLLTLPGVGDVAPAPASKAESSNTATTTFDCQSEGSFPISGNCTSFYYCIKNEQTSRFDPFIVNCGPNLVWDASLGGCYFKDKVLPPCGTKVSRAKKSLPRNVFLNTMNVDDIVEMEERNTISDLNTANFLYSLPKVNLLESTLNGNFNDAVITAVSSEMLSDEITRKVTLPESAQKNHSIINHKLLLADHALVSTAMNSKNANNK